MRRRLASPAFAFVLGLSLGTAALTACSSGGTSSSASPAATAPVPSAAASSAVAAPAPPSGQESPSRTQAPVGRIGDPKGVTLSNGVVVSIPKITMHPVPKGFGSGLTRHGTIEAVVTLVIKNGSTQQLDPTDIAVDMAANGEGVDAVQWSEVATNQISSKVLPGRTATGTYGFVIRPGDEGKLQAQVWAGRSEVQAVLVDGDGTT